MNHASRSHSYGKRAALAALFLAGAALVLAGARLRHANPAVEHAPASSVPRHVLADVGVVNVGRIVGFDLAGGALYLLDGLNQQVVVLRRTDAGEWVEQARFGREGPGPGEFESASGIALLRDNSEVAVVDGAVIQYFTPDGKVSRHGFVRASCSITRPELAASADGVLVSGSCWAGDTLHIALLATKDGQEFQELARDVRITTDGRLGSFLVMGGLFGGGERHFFGSGASSCVTRVTSSGGAWAAERSCDPSLVPWKTQPKPRTRAYLREQQAMRPGAAHMFRWPDVLPYYRAWFSTDSGDVVFRQFSADSMVMRRSGSMVDAAVVPLEGLVGCRREGCLWEVPSIHGATLYLLDRAAAARYLTGGAGQ
jgi:hypothetical protein